MMIETLILSVDECFPKHLTHFVEFYRATVLLEEFTYELPVSAIYLRCFEGWWLNDVAIAWRFAEEPQKIDVDESQPNDKSHDARHEGY